VGGRNADFCRIARRCKKTKRPPSAWTLAMACRTQIDAQDSTSHEAASLDAPRSQSLLAAKDPTRQTLQILLGDPALRDVALSGLAMYDDPRRRQWF